MAKREHCVKIMVSDKDIEDQVKANIKALEKENKSLAQKLERRNNAVERHKKEIEKLKSTIASLQADDRLSQLNNIINHFIEELQKNGFEGYRYIPDCSECEYGRRW